MAVPPEDVLPVAHWRACAGPCDRLWLARALVSPALGPRRVDHCLHVAPAVVAAAVLLLHAIRPLLRRRPQWSKRFAAEPSQHARGHGKTWTHWTAALFLLSALGLLVAIASTILPPHSPLRALAAVPWAGLPTKQGGKLRLIKLCRPFLS